MPKVNHLLLVSSLFSATRMGIGATAVVYMLSRGVSLSDIALIKTVQGVVIFFAEVPTGLVADLWGRKASSMLAIASAMLSFLVFLLGGSLFDFALAEVLNALAIAFWSGAFEALLVQTFKKEAKTHLEQPQSVASGAGESSTHKGGRSLEWIFTRQHMFSSLAIMAGGLIGGALATIDVRWPFLFSLVLGGATLINLWRFGGASNVEASLPAEKASRVEYSSGHRLMWMNRWRKCMNSISENLQVSWQVAVKDSRMRSFFLLQIALQFLMQPVLHYWQPYFKSCFLENTEFYLGVVFFSYVGLNFLVSLVVGGLLKRGRLKVQAVLIFELVVITVSFYLMSFAGGLWLALLPFLFMQGCVGSLRQLLSAGFNQVIPEKQRATVLSSVSFISRLGMLVALLVLQLIADRVPVEKLYLISFAGSIACFYFYIQWMLQLKEMVANRVENLEMTRGLIG